MDCGSVVAEGPFFCARQFQQFHCAGKSAQALALGERSLGKQPGYRTAATKVLRNIPVDEPLTGDPGRSAGNSPANLCQVTKRRFSFAPPKKQTPANLERQSRGRAARQSAGSWPEARQGEHKRVIVAG